jgi:FkbM family methyltransferase
MPVLSRTKVKEQIRHVVNRFGFDVVRVHPMLEHPFDLLGVLIREALPRVDRFTFIQVGANDGKRSDPLHRWITEYGLKGMLIEPLPDLFAALRRTYSDQPQLIFENCAICDTDGEVYMYRVRADAPVPDGAHGLASFNRANLSADLHHIPGLDAHVERVPVKARRLMSLAVEHDLQTPSLLMVDTEGYDAKVVTAALSDGMRPLLIMYEHVHLAPAEHFACNELLQRCGYGFIRVGMDTYAVRDEEWRRVVPELTAAPSSAYSGASR